MTTPTVVDPALIDECIDWITGNRGVSFAELRGWLEHKGMATDGTWSWEIKPNVVVWAGMSQEFVDFLNALRATKRTQLRPLDAFSGMLIYGCDGEMLALPYAKRPPAKGYKDPHWIPTYIDPA
jgi:hypothetical protein